MGGGVGWGGGMLTFNGRQGRCVDVVVTMLYTNGWGGGVGMMMDTLMKLILVEVDNMLKIMIRSR